MTQLLRKVAWLGFWSVIGYVQGLPHFLHCSVEGSLPAWFPLQDQAPLG